MTKTNTPAHGPVTVRSAGGRVECHAASGYSVRDYSGKPAANGIAPRDRQRDLILAFWESQGVARYVSGGAGGGGRWLVRDVLNGGAEWLPLATRDDGAGRADVAEFSHVVADVNGGAWCACNLLPESGAVNLARGGANVPARDLTPGARALLAAWPAWWLANGARKASLARLGA